ncbi:hypothetical protein [Noviherbaspirillum sedimenti]|uniref:Uncharacterized protein n=1 Tax=Noviherbaspirillum sedimenti TaxID=2320865 RepID=A0A3A3G4N7_9BURK|nr:hypothetical protein [Noviherbaspirillum sedimenti]RJG02901.1 hypothetical protein D3878_16025 [Noviherbaspirillum sedimenti]
MTAKSTNSRRKDDALTNVPQDHPQKPEIKEPPQQPGKPPIQQKNPGQQGINPDQKGPAQPGKPGK